ncbi:MAG TPA: hypothetical protein VGW33_07245, partial [Terriglobia bacterium]|nr:hypothetical protein [Terriglobia bacterium]
AEAAAWSPEERRRAERVLPPYKAKSTMRMVALTWLDLDLDVPLHAIEQWNVEVRKAILNVAVAVAEAVAASAAAPSGESGQLDPAGESGQPAPIPSGPAPETPSGESGQLDPAGESGQLDPAGASNP